jgi:hypothetical protein
VAPRPRLFSTWLIAAALALTAPLAVAVEEAAYEPIPHASGLDLRRYPDFHVVAAPAGDDFIRAGNRAFRPLFRYISGANTTESKIAMTAPVLQTRQQAEWSLAFVVPAELDPAEIPEPTSPDLAIERIPGGVVAVARFSGRWTEKRFMTEERTLTKRIDDAGLFVCGPTRYARYDPPFKPPFLRRNEVQIPVSETACRG